jgi:hypothetical protein
MSAHTPTPWIVGYGTLNVVHLDHDNLKGIRIASVDINKDDYETAQANVAHIVRCVNAHDELVAALAAVQSAIETNADDAVALRMIDFVVGAALAKVAS